jgi:sugar-phosphatase
MQIPSGTKLAAHALLFDMDGTLVDSTSVIAGLWRKWSARHGVDPDAVLLASPGRRAVETVKLFAPNGVDAAIEAAELTRAAAEATEGLMAVRGAADLLQSLPKERWAVVTSAERALAHKWLRRTGLPIPDVLIAAEDVTMGKPHPEGYARAAERLGFYPSDTVVFEDAPSGLTAGRAAGAKVIALATTLGVSELDGHDWIRDFFDVRYNSQGKGVLSF